MHKEIQWGRGRTRATRSADPASVSHLLRGGLSCSSMRHQKVCDVPCLFSNAVCPAAFLDTPRVFWADRSSGPPVDSCVRRELRMLFIEELVQKGARSCAVVLPATSASGAAWAGVVYLELPPARGGSPISVSSIEYPPPLELEVLEHACEIKHVIEQHRGHQEQIATQHLERQANAWRHRNLTKTFADAFLFRDILQRVNNTEILQAGRSSARLP